MDGPEEQAAAARQRLAARQAARRGSDGAEPGLREELDELRGTVAALVSGLEAVHRAAGTAPAQPRLRVIEGGRAS